MQHIRRRRRPLVVDPLTNQAIKPIKHRITDWGLQAKVSRMTKIHPVVINFIFNGKRRATLQQAEKLEDAFIRLSLPINRFDLLYGIEIGEENIYEYLRHRHEEID